MPKILAAGRRKDLKSRHVKLGIALLVVIAAAAALAVSKSAVLVALTPGETIKAEFSRAFEMQVGANDIKIAGSKVGKVSGIEQTPHSTFIVSMKVDEGTRRKLGTNPTAAIRPVTVLGGRYYIALSPGGVRGDYAGDTIPRSRTSTPVELPEVLSALQPGARQGLQRTLGDLDGTLTNGGGKAIRSLVRHAPGTLNPASSTLDAVLGERPGTDLRQLVTNLDRTAHTLTRQPGQLAALLERLRGTTSAVSDGSDELAATVSGLPETLRSTRSGMTNLAVTLDKLDATAPSARPSVQALDRALDRLDPVLSDARGVVADLRPLLTEARPTIDKLVPTSQVGTRVLNDLRGPVLDRINGPVVSQLNEKWRGAGPFAGGGANGNRLYQELGHLAARFANLSKSYDRNGAFANLQAGVGTNTLAGTPLDRLLLNLTKIGGAPK